MESEDLELPSETPEEFEIVLGRRQIASVLFVATVILAIFSAVSYLAGKSISPKKIMTGMPVPAAAALAESMPSQIPPGTSTLDATIALPAPPSTVAPLTEPAKSVGLNTSAKSPSPVAANTPTKEIPMDAPMFAEPIAGAMYLQMGAVGKGAAAIFAEGLRKHGFQAFVAGGPSESIYRVLIGPLRDTAAYTRAKDELDRIGVNTFGRKYEK
jgi:cell division septation protein DedD